VIHVPELRAQQIIDTAIASAPRRRPTRVSMQGFIIWLLDLGSNQGPTD